MIKKNGLIHEFFSAFANWSSMQTIYLRDYPKEMLATDVDNEGWVKWRLITGYLHEKQYKEVENRYNAKFPASFISWHKSFFFLDCDCSLIRLPISNPSQPLKELVKELDWLVPERLIPQKLYPFASEGNDMGPLVFDGRFERLDNEFPIRVYDHEYMGTAEGLTEIIFSSFTKLLECMTHYLIEAKRRPGFEIIPEFFNIDPNGAGKTGIDYWLGWAGMQRSNFELFGH